MFTYKGIRASDMHLKVLNDVQFTSPVRDVSTLQIPGRDGDLIMDHGRYESVVRSIPCRLEAPAGTNVEELISQIHNWLLDDAGFHTFRWDNDPNFRYLARIKGGVVSQRKLSRYGITVIDFKLHPVKYLESSLSERQVVSGVNIVNPFHIEAKPVLRIIGNGNLTINIGGRQLVLQGIAGGCILDSETQTITSLDGRITLFERMFSPFPKLSRGDNVITFSGSGVQVFITPRLGALV